MIRKLSALFLGMTVLSILPLLGETVHTERMDFAPGGVIRVMNSFGALTVEGWDRPEVEITVIQSSENVRIVTERQSDTGLAISTILPNRLFTRWVGGKGGVLRKTGATLDTVTATARHPLGGKGSFKLEYQIHAPRDTRLIIHHGAGSVLVSGVIGDTEISSSSGDILLMLPDSGAYSIDARSKLGTVSSDFDGAYHRRHLVGSGFAGPSPSPSHRIYLRTRMGGITIKAVPIEAE